MKLLTGDTSPMKTQNLFMTGLLSLSLLGAGAAHAQEFKFRTYSPGIKSTAGFLSANQRNEAEQVSKGAFSLPTARVNFPSAVRGQLQEVQVDIYALGASISPTGFTTSQSTGVSPIAVKTENCTGKTLAEGEFCSVVLVVDNGEGRGGNTGVLRAQGTDSTGAAIEGSASLAWTVQAPTANQSVGTLSFGEIESGAVSSPRYFVIRTTGAPLTIDNLSAPSGFELSNVNCLTEAGAVNTLPATIRATSSGDYCEFGVTFKPTAAVAYQGDVVVNDNDETQNTVVQVSGVGVAAKSYAVWLNKGKQTSNITYSTDGLTITKNSSWNNTVRLVGSKLLESGKFYIEFDSQLGMSQIGMTPGINVSETTPSDRGFNATTSGLTTLSGSFGMLIDMDARTIQAVNSGCSVSSAVVALVSSEGLAPYAILPTGTGSRGLTSSVNFGQYPMRCSFQGYQNGWFTAQ